MHLPTITQTFQVQFQYQLHFTNGLFKVGNPLLKELYAGNSKSPVKTLVVLDGGLHKAQPQLSKEVEAYTAHFSQHIQLQKIIIVDGGENTKGHGASLEKVLQGINDMGICRHSFVLAIGGGAVIDMAGYAASIAHRGVKLIRIPTTVLAQNDAAVGVKNGINYFGKKNFLGSFATPYAIINDFDLLATLERRDWISGIAEAIKVAVIKDASFFAFLEQNALKMAERDAEATAHMIYRCAQLHMQHIAQGGDPFESGSSRPLDFGHWAAHKLEQMTNYAIRHGEAVAQGIALDVTYAYLCGMIPESIRERILSVLVAVGFELQLPIHSKAETNELLKGIEEFREHLGGQLTITLMSDIGQKKDVHDIDYDLMRQAIAMQTGAKAVSL